MTTRNPLRGLTLFFSLGLLALLFGGCATPGPIRGYYITSADRGEIVQFDPVNLDAPTHEQKSYLSILHTPVGMAYDPFTDHFFIRLQPGNYFLVVDRPAKSVKRAFDLSGFEMPRGSGDLAIRSRDRHLFIIIPNQPRLIETNIDGRYVRTIDLPGLTKPAAGVAYDQARNRLLTIDQDHMDQIDIRTLDGHVESTVTLDHQTAGRCLAFDSASREFYAAVANPDKALGVFSEDGRLVRTLPLPKDTGLLSFDVGPHSFLRLF